MVKKMKIFIINTYYYPNMVGGTEHSVKLLAEGLVSVGHEVCVYSIDNLTSSEIISENINGVKVYRGCAGLYDIKVKMRLKHNKVKLLLNKLVELNNRGCIREINHIIDEFRPEIIHTNNLFGISAMIWKSIRLKNIPIMHTVRDYWMITPTYSLDYLKKGKFTLGVHKLYQWYYRRLSENVNIVTAASEFTLNKFLEYNYFNNAKSISINNCVKMDKNKLSRIVEKRKYDKNRKVGFIYVGSLIEMKGIDRLISAFREIRNDDISLVICGSGPLENMVNEASKRDKRIIYKGQVKTDELEEIFLDNDVLIIPSVFEEPFGRVVIEANINGLPVIGSSRGGIVEIINNIKTGVLFDIDNKNDLKKQIELFTNRDYIKSFYQPILDGVYEYSLEEQIKKFIREYKLMLRK